MKVTPENFAAWNEEMVQRYQPDLYHQHPSAIVRYIEGRRVAELIRMLDAKPDEAILEVGVGAANVLEQVPHGTLTGVDLSESVLEKARARMGDRATLLVGDAEALPFPDQSFDKVYCTEVLEHVLHPEKVLAEMRRVLKPGGYAVVSVPHEHLINFLKAVLVKLRLFNWLLAPKKGAYEASERMDDHWHLHAFNKALIHDKAQGHFTVERIVAVPFAFLPLRYVALLRP